MYNTPLKQFLMVCDNTGSQGLDYGIISPTHKTTTTHSAITDQAGLAHINTDNFKQADVQHELNELITNDFDKEQVLRDLNAQTIITQAFDNERRTIRSEYAQKVEGYKEQAKQAREQGNTTLAKDLEDKAYNIEQNLRLFDGITSALYAPNSNGIIGDVTRVASPQLAYQIGLEFKRKDQEGSAQHLLAHAILGAAVSHATEQDIATGALSGAGSEAVIPVLSNYLYGTKDPKELSQEQKDTLTSIIGLATVTTVYTSTDGDVGSVTDAVNASEVGKVGVENNTLKKSDADELLRQIAYARRHYDGVKLDEEMRRIRSLAAKLAHDNFKEIQACQNNPTLSCINKIKTEYKDVNFASLQDAYHKYQDTDKILSAYEFRNDSLVSCANTNFADCIIAADGTKVMQEAAYAAMGGGIGRGGAKFGSKPNPASHFQRTFQSTDPHVADVANAIERAYPGLVKDVNVPMRRTDNSLITDADILLNNGIIIQVKSGGGKGLTSQISRTETETGLKTIGYGPDLKPSIIKNSNGKATKSLEELIKMVGDK